MTYMLPLVMVVVVARAYDRCHVTAVKREVTYALLLPVVVAALVVARAYDSCHVTSVTKGVT